MSTPATASSKDKRAGKKTAVPKTQTSAKASSGHRPRRFPLFAALWPASSTGRWMMLVILAGAFGLRFYHLLSMFPVLVDESIYMRWGEIVDHQGQWFIAQLDGKQPLQPWILALLRKVFGGDPLWEGRMVSVAAGLLSTVGIFAIGRRLADETAGLIAAFLYAILPYAVFYDRLAYTEALVNTAGIAIVLASLECFLAEDTSWKRALAPGLALGIGLWVKQTVLPFAFFPALVGLWKGRGDPRGLLPRLAVIYLIAAAFFGFTVVTTPEAPTLASHDAFLHHTGYYVKPAELLAHPFAVAPGNLAKLGGYVERYLTLPLAMAALGSLLYLSTRRPAAAWVIASVSLLPLLVESFILSLMFPSRWAFPHFWPWLVIVGMACAEARSQLSARGTAPRTQIAAAALLALAVAGPLVHRSLAMLASPREQLYAKDAEEFLGSFAHAGFGVREAADFFIADARQEGPLVLLTDPIWGPPADAMFAFLNQRHGIKVYEAWWMQLSETYPIMPLQGRAELIKSHYERTKSGSLDFSQLSRVFYITDTNYYPPEVVKMRQPTAQLVASFAKPNHQQAVTIYRLK